MELDHRHVVVAMKRLNAKNRPCYRSMNAAVPI